MNRADKIRLLNDIQDGRKKISSLFKPDLSKLTVTELNKLLAILRNNDKRNLKSITSFTDEELQFLQEIEDAFRTRPVDYGKMMKENEQTGKN